jgi:heptosyltransferase I
MKANFINVFSKIVCENTQMKRILLVKTSSLGDVIHNLAVVNDILQHAPDAQIDWLVDENFADIPRLHSGVKTVFTVAMRRWKKHIFNKKTWQEISSFKHLIQQNQYDAIIDTQGLLKSALAMRYANGVKHGYDKKSIREPLASNFYDKTYNISYQQHAVTRNRTLCAMSLGYAIPTNAPDYGIAKKISTPGRLMDINSQSISLNDSYIIALHGTSRDSKLWPIENWVNLGRELVQQNLSLVFPWASEAEHARAKIMSSQLSNTVILPKLSIAELASVIANAQAAIGVDTGLSHLAAALNIPTIAIYTDTNPALTGVMAGQVAPAVNLGSIAQMPSVSDVLTALKPLI